MNNISITRKEPRNSGEPTHQIISVRMPVSLVKSLDDLADDTNRSRNDLINTLLNQAVNSVKVVD